jgi:predicted peptidase
MLHRVQGLLQLAAKFWPVDLERVVATGYSNGGNASWLFAELAPNIFSAGIPMASSYDLTNMDGSGRKIEVPMYVIHGENDELFPIEITKNWVDLSIQAGSDITFVVAAGLSHYEPCSYSPYLKEAVTWLKETVWK